MFGTRLRDTNCALKLVRRDLLQSLILDSSGFSFPAEVCLKLEALGASLGECPIRHRVRDEGASKLRVGRTAWNMFWFLVYLRFRLRLFRRGVLSSA